MGKVTNEFNRAADIQRAKAMADKGDGRQGGAAGAAHQIARPRELQVLELAARGKELHQKSLAPIKKDNGPEPSR